MRVLFLSLRPLHRGFPYALQAKTVKCLQRVARSIRDSPMALNFKPAYDAIVFAKSDTVNFGVIQDGFMCVTASGDIGVLTSMGDTVVFKTVPLNTFVPVRIQRINSTGTTATGLLGLKQPTF